MAIDQGKNSCYQVCNEQTKCLNGFLYLFVNFLSSFWVEVEYKLNHDILFHLVQSLIID